MIRPLLRLWHRFTLGRTARDIGLVVARGKWRLNTGTVDSIGNALYDFLPQCIPGGVRTEIKTRIATDVPVGTVRIVIEVCK